MRHTLQEIPFFNSLSEESLKRLEQISYFKDFAADELLFYEGDAPDKLHILVDGVLRLYKTNPKGQEIYIHQFVPVAMVGELANFEKMRFPASARFVTSGTVLKIDYGALENIFFRNPEICMEIIKSLSAKLKVLANVIHQEMILTSEAKVAKFIYEHRELFETVKNNQIAAILNVSPETLSRTLAKLKRNGIISIDKSHAITIRDSDGLTKLF